MKTDFLKLEQTAHMFKWLAQEPFEKILKEVESMFKEQVADTILTSFVAMSEPQWLSGGLRTEDDENKVILVRAAVAFECDFTLESSSGAYDLKGIFSWVGVNLNTTPIQQTWMDIDGTLEEFGSEGELKVRIYSVQ